VSYLLDTNICIAFLKGKDEKLIQQIKNRTPEDFALCSIVKAELLFGARNSQKVEGNLNLLKEFFSQFQSHTFDDLAAEFYGTIRVLLTRAGTPIGANDLLIASIALAQNAVLLTRNHREFSMVPGLQFEAW
jgi:tRNA(fMet)-specific endonuclease VapC